MSLFVKTPVRENGDHLTPIGIGDQIWAKENLAVTHFKNGDPIAEAYTNTVWEWSRSREAPMWCCYDSDPKKAETFGLLYNWYAVSDPRGLAPEGWRIPTDEDWAKLENYLSDWIGRANILKAASGWPEKENSKDELDFTALPNGLRLLHGNYSDLNESSYWWTNSEREELAILRFIRGSNGILNRLEYEKGYGCAVRCIKV